MYRMTPIPQSYFRSSNQTPSCPNLIRGQVARCHLDQPHGLNFVMQDAIEGGVNGLPNLDSHGKSWSYLLLALDVEVA